MPDIQSILKDPDFLKLSGPDQVAVLKAVHGDSAPEQPTAESYTSPATGGFMDTAQKTSFGISGRDVSNIARPTLQVGGMVGGSVLGAAAGSPTGPGAAVTGAAGGTLGFAIGTNIADRLDEFLGLTEPMGIKEAAVKTGKDLREGATYEMGGQVGGVAITGAAKGLIWGAEKAGLGRFFRRMKELFPSLSDKGMVLKAKEILKAARKETPEMATAAKESEGVIERLGIKTEPTFAQKTGSTRAAAQEQSLAAKDGELLAILQGRDAQINKEALEMIDEIFKGGGTIDDVMKAVEGRYGQLEKAAGTAKGAVADDVIKLTEGKSVQETGRKTTETLGALKQTEKDAVSAIYNKIPEGITLDAGIMKKTVKTLAADFKQKGGGSKSFPGDIVRQIKAYLKPSKGKTITFDGLRDLRSQIGEEIQESLMGQTPNLKLARRLKMLKSGIDDSLDQMLKLGGTKAEARELYREASSRYKLYSDRFRKGTVGEVLQPGQQATGMKVAYSDVPQRFFRTGKMDAADDLVRAMGKEDAAKAISDFSDMEMAIRLEKGSKATSAWLKQNKEVLNKYGLYNKYSKIAKTQQASDQAISRLDAYSKTVASKALGSDANKVMQKMFSGTGKTKSMQTARELLELPGIKGNPAAIRGVRVAFKDFFFDQIKVTGKDTYSLAKAQNFIGSYANAMKMIYKDAPKQMKALFDYHKLLEIMSRNKYVTYSGGSTTAEKLSGGGETLKTIGRNVAQFAAVQHGAGWKFSVLKNLWSSVFGAPRRYSVAQIEKLLIEAAGNPEVAETIMMATKSNIKKGIVAKRMRHHMISLGLYQADEPRRARLQSSHDIKKPAKPQAPKVVKKPKPKPIKPEDLKPVSDDAEISNEIYDFYKREHGLTKKQVDDAYSKKRGKKQ